MKFLVFGKTGQVSQELQRRAGDVVLEIRGRDEADFTDPETCAGIVTNTDADAVINAVAYTDVDKADEEEALACQVNAATPGVIARAAADRGLPFVHLSTDYVFDGAGEAPRHLLRLWLAAEPPRPVAPNILHFEGEPGIQPVAGRTPSYATGVEIQ